MQETTTQVKTDRHLFIGMDLHKNTSTLCVKNKEGEEVLSKKILTDKKVYKTGPFHLDPVDSAL